MKDPQNKNHLIINPETAPILKRIFKMYLQGMGTLKITKILNEEKIPSPAKYIKSKRYENCNFKWTKASVYRILSNEIYIGTVVGGKSYKVNHKLKTRIITPKEKRIYVENMHEPLIDKTTFHLVQTKLHEPIKCRNRQTYNPYKKFVYCGVCGAKATMKTGKRKLKSGNINRYNYFVCGKKNEEYHNCSNGTISTTILIPIVEEEIKNECSKIFFSEGDLTSIYEQAKINSNSKKSSLLKEISKLEKELKDIEKKINLIYTDKLEGVIKAEDFSKFYDLYHMKKEKKIIRINSLKKELEEAKNEKIVSYEQIKKVANEFLTMKDINEELLGKLIDRIEYNGKKIKIKYKFMESK